MIYSFALTKRYVNAVVFLELIDLVIALVPDFRKSVVKVDISGFLFGFVVLFGMLDDAGGT